MSEHVGELIDIGYEMNGTPDFDEAVNIFKGRHPGVEIGPDELGFIQRAFNTEFDLGD